MPRLPASPTSSPVPVARAADYATAGKGKLYLASGSSLDEGVIKGKGTQFKKQLVVKGQIQLGKAYGFATAEVTEVVDDETVKVKKMFAKDKAVQDLVAAGEKMANGQEDGAGVDYKTLPYIDQTKVGSACSRKAAPALDGHGFGNSDSRGTCLGNA